MNIRLDHEFVTTVPDQLEAATLYVSMPYATAIHLCACGCREQVVTPISPTAWTLTFDGETITLSPSVGNWRLPCRSHYWVRRSRVLWADDSGSRTPPDRFQQASLLMTRVWNHVKRWFRHES